MVQRNDKTKVFPKRTKKMCKPPWNDFFTERTNLFCKKLSFFTKQKIFKQTFKIYFFEETNFSNKVLKKLLFLFYWKKRFHWTNDLKKTLMKWIFNKRWTNWKKRRHPSSVVLQLFIDPNVMHTFSSLMILFVVLQQISWRRLSIQPVIIDYFLNTIILNFLISKYIRRFH